MNHLETLSLKILDKDSLKRTLALWNFKGQKIGFTNGCFDVLHLGHVEYLSKAADLGDVLVIGLNSDRSVRQLKGEGRPIHDEHARATQLAALQFVDAVIVFDEPTPYELIREIRPDVLVKGGDYLPEAIVGNDIVTESGGQVVTVPLTPDHGTSGIAGKIRDLDL